MRRPPVSVSLAVVAALLVPACGSDGDGGGGGGSPAAGGGAELTVVAEDSLDFDSDDYPADAGEITIAYENGGAIVHTLVIEGREDDLRLEVRSGGDVDRGSIELGAGEYVLYCDIGGHRGGGMEATLTVG